MTKTIKIRVSAIMLAMLLACTAAFAAMPTKVQAAEGAAGYITRLYELVLRRGCSQEEVDYYLNALQTGDTASQIAYNFFNSPEFLNAGLDNRNYVVTLYNTMLNRGCSDDEINYYTTQLDSGTTRNYILSCFAASPEFQGICASYGVPVGSIAGGPGTADTGSGSSDNSGSGTTGGSTGGTTSNTNTGDTAALTGYITRLYELVLGRGCSQEEINYYLNALQNGGDTASQLAFNFFNSPEFVNRRLSNDAYVTTLYNTMLGRGCSAEEKSYYTSQLAAGTRRNYILSCFAASPEFQGICANYGVTVGSIDSNIADTQPTDGGSTSGSTSNKLDANEAVQVAIAYANTLEYAYGSNNVMESHHFGNIVSLMEDSGATQAMLNANAIQAVDTAYSEIMSGIQKLLDRGIDISNLPKSELGVWYDGNAIYVGWGARA